MIFVHVVEVDFVFLHVVLLLMMEVSATCMLAIILHSRTTVPKACTRWPIRPLPWLRTSDVLSRAARRLRVRSASRHHGVISRTILTVEHLRRIYSLRTLQIIHVLFLLEHSPLLLNYLLMRWVALF